MPSGSPRVHSRAERVGQAGLDDWPALGIERRGARQRAQDSLDACAEEADPASAVKRGGTAADRKLMRLARSVRSEGLAVRFRVGHQAVSANWVFGAVPRNCSTRLGVSEGERNGLWSLCAARF
jgi:hypothetical protein